MKCEDTINNLKTSGDYNYHLLYQIVTLPFCIYGSYTIISVKSDYFLK
jgi:hypothetical protein